MPVFWLGRNPHVSCDSVIFLGKVPIWPLTSGSNNHPPPPCANPAPIGGGGACDSSVLPKIPIQILQHYRNRGAIAAGRSPWSVSVFRSKADVLFRITFWVSFFYHFLPHKNFFDLGLKWYITLKQILRGIPRGQVQIPPFFPGMSHRSFPVLAFYYSVSRV